MKPEAELPPVRIRILETAWRLIGERRDANVSMLEIARAAGVSRQTVYVNFGSRSGLLLAMVDHKDAQAPELAELRLVDPRQSAEAQLERAIRAWFVYLPVVFDVAHALRLAAAHDADAAEAIGSRLALMRNGFATRFKRLQREGRLARGWTPETASQWCVRLIDFEGWQHLVVELGWKPAELVERTWLSVRATLLRP